MDFFGLPNKHELGNCQRQELGGFCWLEEVARNKLEILTRGGLLEDANARRDVISERRECEREARSSIWTSKITLAQPWNRQGR